MLRKKINDRLSVDVVDADDAVDDAGSYSKLKDKIQAGNDQSEMGKDYIHAMISCIMVCCAFVIRQMSKIPKSDLVALLAGLVFVGLAFLTGVQAGKYSHIDIVTFGKRVCWSLLTTPCSYGSRLQSCAWNGWKGGALRFYSNHSSFH